LGVEGRAQGEQQCGNDEGVHGIAAKEKGEPSAEKAPRSSDLLRV
jgi:hypothetical protein